MPLRIGLIKPLGLGLDPLLQVLDLQAAALGVDLQHHPLELNILGRDLNGCGNWLQKRSRIISRFMPMTESTGRSCRRR